MNYLDFELSNKGKTSGCRCVFRQKETGLKIMLHKSHGSDPVDPGALNDLITYGANSVSEMKKEFESAVDDYLVICKEYGDEPNKSLTGNFNVRIGSKLHKKVALKGLNNNSSQNDIIKKGLEFYFNKENEKALEVIFFNLIFAIYTRKCSAVNINYMYSV